MRQVTGRGFGVMPRRDVLIRSVYGCGLSYLNPDDVTFRHLGKDLSAVVGHHLFNLFELVFFQDKLELFTQRQNPQTQSYVQVSSSTVAAVIDQLNHWHEHPSFRQWRSNPQKFR